MSRSKDNRAENITDLRQLRKERSRRRAWKRLGIFLGILLGAWLVVSGVQGFFSGTYIEDINSFLAMYLPGDGFPVEVTGYRRGEPGECRRGSGSHRTEPGTVL